MRTHGAVSEDKRLHAIAAASRKTDTLTGTLSSGSEGTATGLVRCFLLDVCCSKLPGLVALIGVITLVLTWRNW